jgi:prepilin-type N-terminal cleavage/methylation domain-containing protein
MQAMRSRQQSGMTLIEVLTVVSIVGLLAVLALPNYQQSRGRAARTACIDNLRLIEGAKHQWALDFRKSSADTPLDADLFGSSAYVRAKPACPADGDYILNPVSTPAVCSQEGPLDHRLP